jgi:diadenosine tetraphosphate (Ap4A) HIT family hydrolase
MKYYIIVSLLLFSHVTIGMKDQGKQLECAAGRKNYITQADAHRASGFCVFCNEDSLKTNFILLEDSARDVRVIMNKKPYFPFDQGHHFVVMPISHEEDPDKISQKQLASQCYEAQKLSAALYDNSFGQEFFTNWDKLAGQSVPHWHHHLKNYTRQPLSVPGEIAARKNSTIKTIEQAFAIVQELLIHAPIFVSVIPKDTIDLSCYCCSVGNSVCQALNIMAEAEDLVVAWFKYNYICLSHYPTVPGELSVIPYHHASSIKDLPEESFLENMTIATALLRKTREYAHDNIRESTGGNIYTKSMGKRNEQKGYHVHTLVMPRTVIPATPGTLEGHSCKLDYDPEHYLTYVRGIIGEIVERLK